jgi:uncharacterized protein involved in high-affinity Fe2+ transport
MRQVRLPIFCPMVYFSIFMFLRIGSAHATAYYIGDAIEKNNLLIEPSYLTGIEMTKIPEGVAPTINDIIHLDLDVSAGKGEAHGFTEKSFIPYLTVVYALEKVPAAGKNDDADKSAKPYHKNGRLAAMTALGGPHYANTVAMAGPGQYHLTVHIEPPSKMGFMRHVDATTGVPDWWPPFSLEWSFAYPGKIK